ncbi:MAG: ferredoxin [Chitinivibrionales bacterium]
MKASVNEDICIGCELCVQTCPEVFKMNDDGKAQTKIETVPFSQEQLCKQAAEECPVEAISVE